MISTTQNDKLCVPGLYVSDTVSILNSNQGAQLTGFQGKKLCSCNLTLYGLLSSEYQSLYHI